MRERGFVEDLIFLTCGGGKDIDPGHSCSPGHSWIDHRANRALGLLLTCKCLFSDPQPRKGPRLWVSSFTKAWMQLIRKQEPVVGGFQARQSEEWRAVTGQIASEWWLSLLWVRRPGRQPLSPRSVAPWACPAAMEAYIAHPLITLTL